MTYNHVIKELTLSDFSNACFLKSWKLLFAEGMGTLFGGRSPSFGLPRSNFGLVGVAGGGVCFFSREEVWCCCVGADEVRDERMEAADCFWMVCLGPVATAELAVGGDFTVAPIIIM